MTWGVSTHNVAALIAHLPRDPVTGEAVLTQDSSPTASVVEEWIVQTAARIGNVIFSCGIDPDTLTENSTGTRLRLYHQCRDLTATAVAKRWVAANRESQTEYTESLSEEFEARLTALREECRHVTGETRSTGPRFRRLGRAERLWQHNTRYR